MSTSTTYLDDVSNRDFIAGKIRVARRELKSRRKAVAVSAPAKKAKDDHANHQ